MRNSSLDRGGDESFRGWHIYNKAPKKKDENEWKSTFLETILALLSFTSVLLAVISISTPSWVFGNISTATTIHAGLIYYMT